MASSTTVSFSFPVSGLILCRKRGLSQWAECPSNRGKGFPQPHMQKELALEAATSHPAHNVKLEDICDTWEEMLMNEKQKLKRHKSGSLHILRNWVRKVRVQARGRLGLTEGKSLRQPPQEHPGAGGSVSLCCQSWMRSGSEKCGCPHNRVSKP